LTLFMPKKHVRTQSTDARTADPAAALIAGAKHGTALGAPSDEGLKALRTILDHNDSQNAPTKRVGSQAAIDMLQAHYGWKGASISALNALCRRAFGRKSWGSK
jgi:hypothetical protein